MSFPAARSFLVRSKASGIRFSPLENWSRRVCGGLFGVLTGWLCGVASAGAQIASYDSRTAPAPHRFDWNSFYGSIAIHDQDQAEFHGGFATALSFHEESLGTLYQGDFDSIGTHNQAKLAVFGGTATNLSVRDQSTLDVWSVAQVKGQAIANGDALLRAHGGHFGRVYTWPSGGRIELVGNPVVGELSANGEGVVIQNGGQSDSLACAYGGLAVLDGGTVQNFISASYTSTLILAGGWPPEQSCRLFDQARVLAFHGGASVAGTSVQEKRRTFVLADFKEPGMTSNYAVLPTFLTLDGFGRAVDFSAWRQAGEEWTGSLELIRIDDDLHLEVLANPRAAVLAFRALATEVVQVESSGDLKDWLPLGEAAAGDGNVHVRVARIGTEATRYFRLRKWQKP